MRTAIKRLSLKLTREDLKVFQDAASNVGMNVSEYLRYSAHTCKNLKRINRAAKLEATYKVYL